MAPDIIVSLKLVFNLIRGTRSPLFFARLFQNLYISTVTCCWNAPRRHWRRLFIISHPVIRLGAAQDTVTLDGPNGLAIQACATISRRPGRRIGEGTTKSPAYSLEVTSRRHDQPLTDRASTR
jgi:hypothetical protein